MKFARIQTPNRPTDLPPFTVLEELDLGEGRFARVVLTRSAVDPRTVDATQGDLPAFVTVTKKAVQIDAQGNLVQRPDGLASATRTTTENVDTTAIGDTHSWRPAWVRTIVPIGENWHAENLPPGCTLVDALPAAGEPGQRVYLDPTVFEWTEGLVAAMVDGKGEELERILRNSAQLANTGF